MSLDDRFFCTPQAEGFVTTLVDCPFNPSATKRIFAVKKGVYIDDASDNLNLLTWWEDKIASGDIIPLPDGSFVDITTNYQEGTIGTKTVKISDGETMATFQASNVPCLIREFDKLQSNNSNYDMFIITEIGQLIGKYDADADAVYPIELNSIDVRSKPLFADGTAVEQILDSVILRYNEFQSKEVTYFNISDSIANITGLRAVLLEVQSNDSTTVTVKAVTKCEGIEVNDLTTTSDWLIVDDTGADVSITTATSEGNGLYTLDAALTATEVYLFSLNGVAANNESYTEETVSYTAT